MSLLYGRDFISISTRETVSTCSMSGESTVLLLNGRILPSRLCNKNTRCALLQSLWEGPVGLYSWQVSSNFDRWSQRDCTRLVFTLHANCPFGRTEISFVGPSVGTELTVTRFQPAMANDHGPSFSMGYIRMTVRVTRAIGCTV